MNATRGYYIRIRGRVIGPKELPDMQRLAKRAQLNSRTPVSEDGLSWLTAGDFPEIFTSAAEPAPVEEQQPPDKIPVAEEWHFAVNGQQHPDPVSLATLKSYVQAGTLGDSDLVYRAGWDNWRPVSSVPELSDTIPTGSFVIAEFMPRVGATLLDGLFLGGSIYLISCCCVFSPIVFLGGAAGFTAENPAQAGEVIGALGPIAFIFPYICTFLLFSIVSCLYYIVLDSSRKQGTWGKQIVGLKVVDLQGGRLTIGRATGRCFGRYVTCMTFFIGFLMALFTEKKQTLHELMAGCLTVNA